MRTEAEADDAMSMARVARKSLLLAQARGHGRAVLLARLIFAVPMALLLGCAIAFSAPQLMVVAIALSLGFTAAEMIVDRRLEALLSLIDQKDGADSKAVVETARVPRLGPYSQAVRWGDLLFTAGQAGMDPKTGVVAGPEFEAQARQAFDNLRALLEDAGSGMEHVLRVTCFLTDPGAFATLNSVFAEYFPVAPPVRSAPVVALPKGLLFSIEAIAVARP